MSRPLGGYIGHRPVPAAATLNSVARGIWTLREAQRLKQVGTWPRALQPNTLLAVNFDEGFDDIAQGLTASQTDSGPTRSTTQKQAGTHSLFVGSTFGVATTRRIQYGSGSAWNIMHSDFTVECWLFVTSNVDYRGIVGRDNGSNARHWAFYFNSAFELSELRFSIFNTTNSTFLDIGDTVAMTLNQWVHVAAVRDGSVLRLYKNGTQVASANVSAGSGTIATASGVLSVGSLFESGGYALPGYIDELLITTSCRYPNGTTFTPPASIGVGVSAPAVPLTISGLQLWLDAADPAVLYDATTGGSLVAADGGVARWEDKSGNGRHAIQATGANRPARKTGVQGGLDVLRFDGSNDFLESTDFLDLSAGQAITIIAVIKRSTANATHTIVSKYTKSNASDGNTADGWGFRLLSTNAMDFFGGTDENAGNSVRVTNGTVDASAFTVLSLKASAGAISNATLYRNSSTIPSSATVSGAETLENTAFPVLVGALMYTNNIALQHLNGDIAEIIIYDTALSDTNRGLVESYLMSKWAIT